MKILAFLSLLTAGLVVTQDMPAPTKPTDQHKWLHQLVGEWDVTIEAMGEGGGEGQQMESSESMRKLGELWVIGEGKAAAGGNEFRSMLTLGYDPAQKSFVGSWIDTVQTRMWVYRGSLDEEQKVLTLEAEGPSFSDPTKTTDYRDVIELKGPDHRTLTSSARGDDGEWITFMRADYRRTK